MADRAADRLVALGHELFVFHVTSGDAEPYGVAPGATARRRFTGKNSVRAALAKRYNDEVGRVPAAAALSAALAVLAEVAHDNGPDPADRIADAVADLTEPGPAKSAATLLVDLALDRFDLGCTPDGEPFTVPKTGPRITRMLRGGRQSARAELASAYFEKYGSAAAQGALADACAVLEGMAQQQEPTELHLRTAQPTDGQLVLDLGDATGRAVLVTRSGWQVIDEPPVLFRRTALTAPLPVPQRGGSFTEDLWPVLNVAEVYRPLLLAVLVAAMFPNIPHPITGLLGEQGVGKSSATAKIAAVLDPSPAQLRKAPRDADTWTTAAAGSWVVALDNLSGVTDAISDALCRASTGDGDVRRRLYSDGDLHVVAFRRVVIVNGIDLGAVKDDLADRMVTVTLERIPDRRRRLDAEIAAAWAAAHPRVLGALLDLTTDVLDTLPTVQLDEMPRMADYARILAAVDQVHGTTGLRAYLSQRTEMAEDALNSDPVLTAIDRTVTQEWVGTAAELLDHVTPADDRWRAPKGWPAKPREMTTVLKRRAPSLRRLGWRIEQAGRDSRARAVTWRVVPPPERSSRADDARDTRNARTGQEAAGHGPVGGASEQRANGGEASDTTPERSHPRGHSHDARTLDDALTCGNEPFASDASETSDNPPPSPYAGGKCALCGVGAADGHSDGLCPHCRPTTH